MRLRTATARDVEALARLMAASPLLARYGTTAPAARRALREALRARDAILVAVERDRALGLAWVISSRALDRSAHLRLLLVAEGARSRGVGAALLARAESGARARGARHLSLLVTSTNRGARRFYERAGYRRVGRLPAFVRAGLDEVLYVKSWVSGPRASPRSAS